MCDKTREQEERENRVDELINLVERKIRTERHLEQHSDIGDPDRLERPKELQNVREDEIKDLKDKIVFGTGGSTDELENLKRNYKFTEGYIDHNSDHMNKSDLENLKEKQENRKDQMNTLQ